MRRKEVIEISQDRILIRRLVDVTHSLEEKLDEQEATLKKLKDLEEIKKSFMRMASHELRAPLAALQSCLRVLISSDVMDPEDTKKLLNNAHARGEDMLELVNDILELAQSESIIKVETDVSSEEIDVEKAIRDISNFYSSRAKEKKLKFVFDVQSPVGVITANRKLFNQVVINLTSNAIRYSDPGREIILMIRNIGDESIAFEVTNWGIVISEVDKKNLFTEFWRSNEARKKAGHGTGLGLSIVKNIIDFRGGGITVTSDEENGTCFSVIIPRIRIERSI